jgi:hypothetical protein
MANVITLIAAVALHGLVNKNGLASTTTDIG